MSFHQTLQLIDRLEAFTLNNQEKLKYDDLVIKDYCWCDKKYPELVISRSNVIGIFGPSGSGKSTFVRNILGITKHSSGCILLYNQGLKTVIPSLSCCWQSISYYCESRIFVEGTILENIAAARNLFTHPGTDYKSCDPPNNTAEARLHLIATYLGMSLDESADSSFSLLTRIDKYGSNLSAGQIQRLCLARTLIKDADLFIFDEPTSKLDYQFENKFFKLLKALNSTVLLVTHSNNLIKQCDVSFAFTV